MQTEPLVVEHLVFALAEHGVNAFAEALADMFFGRRFTTGRHVKVLVNVRMLKHRERLGRIVQHGRGHAPCADRCTDQIHGLR